MKLSKTYEGLSGPRILECVSKLCYPFNEAVYPVQYVQYVRQPGGSTADTLGDT